MIGINIILYNPKIDEKKLNKIQKKTKEITTDKINEMLSLHETFEYGIDKDKFEQMCKMISVNKFAFYKWNFIKRKLKKGVYLIKNS